MCLCLRVIGRSNQRMVYKKPLFSSIRFFAPGARVERLAGDARGLVGRQIDEYRRDILGRRQRQGVFLGIGRGAHGRAGRARVDRVGADVRLFDLVGQDLGEAFHAELRRGVGAPTRLADAPDAGGDVDDRAFAPRDHDPERLLGEDEQRGEVDPEDLLPVFQGIAHDRRARPEQARVLDQDVDRAVAPARLPVFAARGRHGVRFEQIFAGVFIAIGSVLILTAPSLLRLDFLRDAGLGARGRGNFLFGFLLAVASMAALGVVMWLSGSLDPQVNDPLPALLRASGKALFTALLVGFFEELFFRGALFKGLLEDAGRAPAFFAANLFYAASHFIKPPEDFAPGGLDPWAGVRFLVRKLQP